MLNGKVYEDLFPVDYTKRNWHSKKWHGHFIDRICQLFVNRSIGLNLKANPAIESVILVNYENFQQQDILWARGSSQQSQKRHYVWAFSQDVEDTCFNNPSTSNYQPWLPSDEQIDLTPILGAAAGWARVHVVQRKCCSNSSIYKLDVSIINAQAVTTGQVTDFDASAGQEVRVVSKTPFAIRVITQEEDEYPLVFRYGED